LKKFIQEFENLYSPLKMVYNVHLLSHIVNSVKQTGPLWAISTFHFESNNRKLVNYVHGTKDPIKRPTYVGHGIWRVQHMLDAGLLGNASLNKEVAPLCQARPV
jgi:hypothetical protein